MKDEIKEIVRRMNDLIEHQFDKEYHTKCNLFKDIQSLLDYITNLQEENMIKIKEKYPQLEFKIFTKPRYKIVNLESKGE